MRNKMNPTIIEIKDCATDRQIELLQKINPDSLIVKEKNMKSKIIDFILNSKWYDYRKAVKNQELNVYGKEMGQSLSDEFHTAVIYLTSVANEQPLPLQRFTVLKLDLGKLKDEFFNINVKYKLEPIEEPYQDRKQMFSSWGNMR